MNYKERENARKVSRFWYEKYKAMAERVGLRLTEADNFLGLTLDEWRDKWNADPHLNNVPLYEWDNAAGNLMSARKPGGPTALFEGVCLYKWAVMYQLSELTPDLLNE